VKTFIFGKTFTDGEYYKQRQFITQADVITGFTPLKEQAGCTLHLVGPYYLSKNWPELELFLIHNREKLGINVINREWDYD
jgi:hypothetical protein